VVVFQQQNISENLQRQGGFVPGIRPGRPTQEYINRVLLRIPMERVYSWDFSKVRRDYARASDDRAGERSS